MCEWCCAGVLVELGSWRRGEGAAIEEERLGLKQRWRRG